MGVVFDGLLGFLLVRFALFVSFSGCSFSRFSFHALHAFHVAAFASHSFFAFGWRLSFFSRGFAFLGRCGFGRWFTSFGGFLSWGSLAGSGWLLLGGGSFCGGLLYWLFGFSVHNYVTSYVTNVSINDYNLGSWRPCLNQ